MKTDQVAKLVTIQDGKVLLLKEYGKDNYGFPGGKVEVGETIERGLIREIMEELNCKPLNYRLFSEVSIPGWSVGEVYHFIYFIGDFEGQLKVGSEIESLAWVGKKDLEENLVRLHPHVVKTRIMEDLLEKKLVY